MRIKKYENWKLSNTHHPTHFSPNRQKTSEIFSISQLLETPKKSLQLQNEHQYIFTDPKAINHTLNLHRRILTKKDIQINQLIRPSNRTEREQIIKNKIKERIKEEFANQNCIESVNNFFNQQSPINNNVSSLQDKKLSSKQSRVYIKGNSVAFNLMDKKKRSKSILLRTSLPNFNQKFKFNKCNGFPTKEAKQVLRPKFFSVQIKRKNSSCLATRQKTLTSIKRKNSLKQIEPWQFDEGPQPFEL